ncbi:hypothetical protein [Actinomadura sp. HBU206391]|uniref:hypothetical protein n=1 Tax=Actinomadura sp. HBU206391 TaxID=2731692 RepID=UPI001650BCB7|nr:hypothetical protein [Actinomadura sp. HBU206391]MBC6456636.1 hypothetical protein [Actinomadura sp. HBU206391]
MHGVVRKVWVDSGEQVIVTFSGNGYVVEPAKTRARLAALVPRALEGRAPAESRPGWISADAVHEAWIRTGPNRSVTVTVRLDTDGRHRRYRARGWTQGRSLGEGFRALLGSKANTGSPVPEI